MATVLGVALTATGCPSSTRPRQWVACSCSYVTDYDQPGHLSVEVCTNDEFPQAAAESCAEGAGVGVLDRCRCDASSATPCGPRDHCRLP